MAISQSEYERLFGSSKSTNTKNDYGCSASA